MLAAAAGRPFQLGFGGEVGMQYAPDVAALFVAAALAEHHGAGAFNLRGSVTTVEAVVDAIETVVPGARELLEVTREPLGIPADLSDAGLRAVIGSVPDTPLHDGVRDTVERFRALLAEGRMTL
jgi:nucleoside-diphosphate-sugar epimerase